MPAVAILEKTRKEDGRNLTSLLCPNLSLCLAALRKQGLQMRLPQNGDLLRQLLDLGNERHLRKGDTEQDAVATNVLLANPIPIHTVNDNIITLK